MSAEQIYSLAHTAQCKLRMAADRPDRNLRFILGHAFTLDKLILRVVEIESESSGDDDDLSATQIEDSDLVAKGERRVSFRNNAKPQIVTISKNKSPPLKPGAEELEPDYDDEDVEEDGELNDLSLQRFPSASAQPPRIIDDLEDDSDDDVDEAVSPPSYIWSDQELQDITEGNESKELANLYAKMQKCTCHGSHEDAPAVEKAWEVSVGEEGRRVGVVQVAV